jgi:hypothetical protein
MPHLDRAVRIVSTDIRHLPFGEESKRAVHEVAISGAETSGLADNKSVSGKSAPEKKNAKKQS